MMCEKLRGDFMEAVLSGPETASPQLQEHLRSCAACARELASFQQTMSVLDEWQAPEPSPYFSSRLRAQMRAAAAMQPSGWLAWLRRPVAAVAAIVLVAGPGAFPVFQFPIAGADARGSGDAAKRLAGMVAQAGGRGGGYSVGGGWRRTVGDGPRESRPQHPGDQ